LQHVQCLRNIIRADLYPYLPEIKCRFHREYFRCLFFLSAIKK
jgi:hypothetical protein